MSLAEGNAITGGEKLRGSKEGVVEMVKAGFSASEIQH